MHAPTLDARSEIRKWLPVLKASFRLSQNAFAREADIDPTIFSRWLNSRVHESAAEKKALKLLRSYKRRFAQDEKAS
jgi:hypothetical protein